MEFIVSRLETTTVCKAGLQQEATRSNGIVVKRNVYQQKAMTSKFACRRTLDNRFYHTDRGSQTFRLH
jgi:hypothetical protein